MADKQITELAEATTITGVDLFVLEQDGTAKKLTGQKLLDFVTLSVVNVTVTTLPAGSQATAVYDKATGILSLGIPQGDKGETGETGATGATPNLQIGEVTSLDAGSQATASITGTEEEPLLNLGIPKGATGPQGPEGPQGKTGATGPAGADGNRLYVQLSEPTTANEGDYWINTSTYNISRATWRRQSDGSEYLYWVKLGNIKGDKGDTGATGATGPAGADGVTPHIGDNGNWFLGDTDTGVAAAGATGATGPTGPAGADGKTPVKGTDYWTAADQAEIVNDVLAALPTWTGGSY